MRSPFTSWLWRNGAFVRLWTASTISVFGSLITRLALPFVAILVLDAGAIEVAALRSVDLAAALVFGLAAGAWVDRLRRRPVLIASDLGRAVLLVSVRAFRPVRRRPWYARRHVTSRSEADRDAPPAGGR